MTTESTTTITSVRQEPEIYVRGEISQNAKGEYRILTTASVTMRGAIEEVEDLYREVLEMADTVARQEVTRRTQRDIVGVRRPSGDRLGHPPHATGHHHVTQTRHPG